MKRFALLLAVLMVCLVGFGQTIGTATGTYTGNFTLTNNQTLTLKAQIVGCNGDTPIYGGNAISIRPNQTSLNGFPTSNQVASITLPGNDAISCGGQNYSLYAFTWLINGYPAGPTKTFRLTEGTTFNLNTQTSTGFIPPQINNTIGSQCPSGQALNGYNQDFTPVCQPNQPGPQGPPGTVTATGPNGNWAVPGIGSTFRASTKLGLTDPTYPDFGPTSGCGNQADPTGTLASDCAIQAALTYQTTALGTKSTGPFPPIHLSSGRYLITNQLQIPYSACLEGDSINSTVLVVTPSAHGGLNFYNDGSNVPGTNFTNGACHLKNITITCSVQGTIGTTYNGCVDDAIDVNTTYMKLDSVSVNGWGGRGINISAQTEQVEFDDVRVFATRWPIVDLAQANTENHNIYINGHGQDSNGYCFSQECIKGTFHSQNWNPSGGVTIASLAVDGTGKVTATINCTPSPACYNEGVNATSSPVAAGHWIVFNGITAAGLTFVNGNPMEVTSVSGSPGSPFTLVSDPAVIAVGSIQAGGVWTGGMPNWGPQQEFVWNGATLQNPGAASATSPTGSFQIVVKPDNNYAETWLGAQMVLDNNRIDPDWYGNDIQVVQPMQTSLNVGYTEFITLQNQARGDSTLHIGGYLAYTTITAPINTTSTPFVVPLTSAQWLLNYASNPNQQALSNWAGAIMIMSPCYNPNQTLVVDTCGVQSSEIVAGTINTAGSGYTNGDVVTVVQSGGSNGKFTLTVSGGTVTALTPVNASPNGSGYTNGSTGLSVTGGTGSGLLVNITTGIFTNQTEGVNAVASSDGMHVFTRDYTSTSVPAGTVWPSGSRFGYNRSFTPLTTIGAGSIEVKNYHTNDVFPGNANYYLWNIPGTILQTGSIIQGPMWDDFNIYQPGYAGSYNQSYAGIYQAIGLSACGSVSTPMIGEQCLIGNARGSITILAGNGMSSSQSELPSVLNGTSLNATSIGVYVPQYLVNGVAKQPALTIVDVQHDTIISNSVNNTQGTNWFETRLSAMQNVIGIGQNCPNFSSSCGHQYATNDSEVDMGGYVTTGTATAWSRTNNTGITFTSTMNPGTNACVVVSGLVQGYMLNSNYSDPTGALDGNCYQVTSSNSTQFTANIPGLPIFYSTFPTSATETANLTVYHSAMNFLRLGGPTNTGTSVGWKFGLWTGTTWNYGLTLMQTSTPGNILLTCNATCQMNILNFQINGSQIITGIQGGTGTKLAAATGSFTNGHPRCSDVNLNEVDCTFPASSTTKYTQSITPAAVTASTCAEQTFTVTGLATGQWVGVSPPAALSHTWIQEARVSASNTLAIGFCGDATGGTPPSGSWVILAQ